MKKPRPSLRCRLTLFAWCLALVTAVVLTLLLQLWTRRQLLQHLEKTLQTRVDEVITVLDSGASNLSLEEFLLIETKDAETYFYDIRDARGRILARSKNLGAAELSPPAEWRRGETTPASTLRTMPDPTLPGDHRIRVRSERVQVRPSGHEPVTVVIQTAVSLASFEAAVRKTLRDVLAVAAGALAAIFLLLWFVTTRALRPVEAMTRKASQITAKSFRERIPLTGRGDELDELGRVLNDMLDRLSASLRQMEQFSSDAAHQLRTPLTRMRGELDLVLRSELPDGSRGQLERIRHELERMSRLCGRLLLLARLDRQAGGASLFDERVDLEEVVSDVLDQVTPLAQDHGVGLRRHATSGARVRGNRRLLVEALLNLLDNAMRCTPRDGFVTVTTQANGDVELWVRDTGPGIPSEERERIFQRFYRIPRATEGSDDGSGLGLAIVMGIAQAHGGRVELVDSPQGGAAFRLVLPRDPTP